MFQLWKIYQLFTKLKVILLRFMFKCNVLLTSLLCQGETIKDLKEWKLPVCHRVGKKHRLYSIWYCYYCGAENKVTTCNAKLLCVGLKLRWWSAALSCYVGLKLIEWHVMCGAETKMTTCNTKLLSMGLKLEWEHVMCGVETNTMPAKLSCCLWGWN